MRRIAPMLPAAALALSMLAFAPATGETQDTSSDPEPTTAQDAPSFNQVGSMGSARYRHTATLLQNGKILIAGGGPDYPQYTTWDTAELFDPAEGTFTALPPMTTARQFHTATMLPSGKVLLAGGATGSGRTDTAELFDPASGTFTALSDTMTLARQGHTATLLPNGKVLIAGGFTSEGPTKATELFDPATGTFTAASRMTKARFQHTATLLQSGTVLFAGSNSAGSNSSTAELYDPTDGTFTPLPPLNVARDLHTATLLPGGKVLLAGGQLAGTATAELFDPASGSFTLVAPMTSPRQGHTATLLPNGKVLLAGGNIGIGFSNTAEVFDPASGTFTSLLPTTMTAARAHHSATMLPSGRILLAGGHGGSDPLGDVTTNTAELFDPASGGFTSLLPNTMNLGRLGHTATQLPNGEVLIAGGQTGDGVTTFENTDTAELFDPETGTFTPLASTMSSRRVWHTATLLPSGEVLLAGGFGFAYRDTAELFDPDTGTFTDVPGTMGAARRSHTATLLRDGKVLLTGGRGPSGHTDTAELFDPVSGTFTSPSAMNLARVGHTATLLPSGKVLITGGREVDAVFEVPPTNTAELFDPATGTFTTLSSTMTSRRTDHTSTLLPSGQVLITGGNTGSSFSNTAELFDPATQTFTPLANTMVSERYFHNATLLPNGTVLITGGSNLFQGRTGNTAELFDPATGTFRQLPPMTAVRYFDTATLLPNGKVLIAGGPGEASHGSNTAELFDTGLDVSDARRPVLSTVPDPLVQPASLVVGGTGFRGDSEGSGSAFGSSATNYPLVQLMRVDSGQTFFPLSDPETNWSDTEFASETLGAGTPLPAGHYRVMVSASGIPSMQRIVLID